MHLEVNQARQSCNTHGGGTSRCRGDRRAGFLLSTTAIESQHSVGLTHFASLLNPMDPQCHPFSSEAALPATATVRPYFTKGKFCTFASSAPVTIPHHTHPCHFLCTPHFAWLAILCHVPTQPSTPTYIHNSFLLAPVHCCPATPSEQLHLHIVHWAHSKGCLPFFALVGSRTA
jgi:hypothetical protein